MATELQLLKKRVADLERALQSHVDDSFLTAKDRQAIRAATADFAAGRTMSLDAYLEKRRARR